MAGEDLLTYTGQASIAYQDALNQARNMQNSLLRQFGFTMPGADGQYSVEAAQGAFDPNKLFSRETGQVDTEALSNLIGGLSVGGKGVLADIGRAGATAEAESMSEMRGRGFGSGIGGGLVSQRQRLAESVTGSQMGQAREQFVSGMAQALSPISGSWQQLQTAMAQDAFDQEMAKASESTVGSEVDWSSIVAPQPSWQQEQQTTMPSWQDPSQYNPKDFKIKGTPGDKPGKPSNPGQQHVHRGPGGVIWLWRPALQGWYKKG